MKKLIVANWKMNPGTYAEAEVLVSAVKAAVSPDVEVVLCPPFPWLTDFSHKEKGIALGAQNMFWENAGAFTGEVSPVMLKSSGVQYVIVGHSERRKYFGETNEMVNKKLKAALAAGLTPILCIGDNEGENKEEVLKAQITEGLANIKDLSAIVIAYEPVWAIGTGNNCSPEETKSSIELIKKLVNVRVLYGGSVKADNSASYLKEAGADGLLVGGASLKSEEFIAIVKSAE